MASLFVSHSSQDHAEVGRLCSWLAEQGLTSLFLGFDADRGIPAGSKWEAELYAQLRRADAVLFVGSPASVVSQWCFVELAMARSLGKTIVPVVLRTGGSHPLLDDTQAVDLTDSDPRGLERLRRSLLLAELDPERAFEWDPLRSPFPGLESFEERDAAVFYGRRAETEILLAQMRSSRQRYNGRLAAVVGPSGSGKSSLVRAGLVPRLRKTQPPWVVLSVLRPADRPLRQLALALVHAFRDAGASRSLASVELVLDEGSGGLVALAEELSHLHADDSPRPVLVFVDQAEELITPGEDEEHARFLAVLHSATRGAGPVWSLLTLRSEFLSAFLHAERAQVTFDDQLLVAPLDASRLAEVIERPADRAGVSFAPGLVGRMVADTGGGDALPLLAHTLAALHERACSRKRAIITIGDYEDLGGVVGALRRSADDVCRRLYERGLGDVVIPALHHLVAVGPEGRPTRRRLARAAFSREEDEVVQAFIDARLLASAELDGESVVEVAHEALLRQWPPLTQAIERDREQLQLRSELERAAEDWERNGRRDDYLLSGERLAAAGRLTGSAQRRDHDLTALQRAFLTASRDQRRRQEAATRRRTRRTVLGLAGALVAVSALALVALILAGRAADQRDTAQADRLATDAFGGLPTDPGQSLVVAMQAYATKRTSLAEGALRVAAHEATPQLVLRGHRGVVTGVAFARDGRHLASAGIDGTVRVWDWRAPRTPPILLRSNRGTVASVAFASDGRHLADGGDDGTVRVWNWRRPRTPPIVLRSSQRTVTGLAFTRDGRHLASAGGDGRASAHGTVRVWNWRASRTPPTVLRRNEGVLTDVAFAADGRRLASVSGDGVLVWDWRRPRTPPIVLRSSPGVVRAVAFAGDARHLAVGGQDGTIRVWNWRTPRNRPIVLRSREPSVTVAFTEDGRYLASGGDDGIVRVWDWRTPRTRPIVLRSSQGVVSDVAFAGDRRHLATAGSDGSVRVWEWRTRRTRPTVLRSHHWAQTVAFAGDRRHLATAGRDGLVQVWDWRAPRNRPTVLRSHQRQVTGVAFAGDERHLASAGNDGTVRVWDWRAPRTSPIVLRGHQGAVIAVEFAPDQHHLASAGVDETVRVWDWRSPHTPPIVMRGHQGAVNAVAFVGDRRHLASGGEDGTVRIWNWRAPTRLPTVLSTKQGRVTAVASAGDERRLASAGNDGTVRVWDWRAPRTLIGVLRGHQGAVNAVAFVGDQRHLASGGKDGTVRVWDWRSPATPHTILRGHQPSVTAATFPRLQGSVNGVASAGDGRHFASAANDTTVWVWDCERCGDINDVVALAHARVPREIGPG